MRCTGTLVTTIASSASSRSTSSAAASTLQPLPPDNHRNDAWLDAYLSWGFCAMLGGFSVLGSVWTLRPLAASAS